MAESLYSLTEVCRPGSDELPRETLGVTFGAKSYPPAIGVGDYGLCHRLVKNDTGIRAMLADGFQHLADFDNGLVLLRVEVTAIADHGCWCLAAGC